MQQSKIKVQPAELADLTISMRSGKLQVPRFQRDFVWPLSKTRRLLDSMYKEWPIGTLFLWRAPADMPALFRPLSKHGIPDPPPGTEVSYILDGQQRLASLFFTINGRKWGSRDYGRICLDLETATKFEQNEDEGFEEDIFVYHTPDGHRYVSVPDLVGPDTLMIFKNIPEEWQMAFNKASNLFKTYPFSVVWIQGQNLGDAIEIFQRINQAGKRLSRYDLVCANVWTEDFDFRKRVKDVNQIFRQQGFGDLHETIYTQSFALVLEDQCTTAAELSLKTDEIREVWDGVVRALQLAVDFVTRNLGVKRYSFLPYRGILAVLAYYFYHLDSSALSAQQRETLWSWFWQVTLSERYSSTSPSRMAEDAAQMRELIDGKPVAFNFPSKVTADAVRRTRMTSSTSALRNAVICMLTLKQPRNLKDGSPVNIGDDFFSNLKRAERHHIFPVGYLKSQGWPGTSVHTVPNFCFIPSDLNSEIGSQPPATYLAQYKDANPQFDLAAQSHLVPVDAGAAVWSNHFDRFLVERGQLIADQLNRQVDGQPPDIEISEADLTSVTHADKVGILEVRLRNFIDHRLTAVVGSYYWKQTMPGDIVVRVRQLISDHLAHHPYEDESEFALGRKKLDFCDVGDYDKIILKNWAQFEDIFRLKDSISTHMGAFRAFRNCVQHNREPSLIERKNGEAAVLWIERVLDMYDRDYVQSNEDGDAQGPATEDEV